MDIIIKNLSYTYNPNSPFEQKVLDNINVKIEAKKWISIIGRTGSGKSTLVQHMNGLLHPTFGTIQIGEITISSDRKKKPPLFNHVGMVFQYPEHQLFEETVAKDIAFGPKNLDWPEQLIQSRVQKAIQLVGLDPSLLDRSPFELSGGQKRRVAIAGVLVMQPKVLILDEPTAGLDPVGKSAIMNMLAEWQKSEESTVIVITHQMDDVAEYADEVIVLSDGTLKLHTDPLTLFTRYAQELKEIGLGIPNSVQLLEDINQKLEPPIPITSVKKKDIIKQIANYLKRKDKL